MSVAVTSLGFRQQRLWRSPSLITGVPLAVFLIALRFRHRKKYM